MSEAKRDIEEIICELEAKRRASKDGTPASAAQYVQALADSEELLCTSFRVLRKAFNDACQLCDIEHRQRNEAENILEALYTTINNDLRSRRIIPNWATNTPMGRAKAFLQQQLEKKILPRTR